MRRDQGDEPAELLDLARGPAQAGRIILGVDPRPGQRRAVETPSSSRDRLGRIALSIVSSALSNWRWSIWLMAPL